MIVRVRTELRFVDQSIVFSTQIIHSDDRTNQKLPDFNSLTSLKINLVNTGTLYFYPEN